MAILEQKFQVFVSSTYEDLIEERSIASISILRSSCIPVGMELSSGANDKTISVIYSWIDTCDIFVLILGGRYGAVSPSQGISYTHLEFNYAVNKKIPVIAIVLTDRYLNEKVSSGKIEASKCFERVSSEKLNALRHAATAENYCSVVNSFGEIEPALLRALATSKQQRPSGGWVRREDCLAIVADAYSHYIDLYLSTVTSNGKIGDDQITSILRALHQIFEAVICPAIGWIDIVMPTTISVRDRSHLLINDIVSDDHWLRVRYSSMPRTNPPTLIPIEVHGEAWRGSGAAFRSGHIDYVGDFSTAFPRKKYRISPALERRINDRYRDWKTDHYFASLLAICIKDPENQEPMAVVNINFRQTDALGQRAVINPQTSARIMSIAAPAIRVVVSALKQ